MSKSFWDDWGTLIIVIWVALGSFIAGMEFADMLNPYEQCQRGGDCSNVRYVPAQNICEDMYNTDGDIGECVWILENP